LLGVGIVLVLKIKIMSKIQDTAMGLIAGLAIGGALGLLLAPQSGEETRKMISNKTGDLLDRLKDMKEDLIKSVSFATTEEVEKINEYLEDLESYIDDLSSKGKKVVSAAKAQAKK